MPLIFKRFLRHTERIQANEWHFKEITIANISHQIKNVQAIARAQPGPCNPAQSLDPNYGCNSNAGAQCQKYLATVVVYADIFSALMKFE